MFLEENKIYQNKELAEWFGISYHSFRNVKKKKLEELEEYADFYEDKSKIVVTKVYIKEYVPKRSPNKTLVSEQFYNVWSKTGIDTASRASQRLYRENEDKLTCSEATLYHYYLAEKKVRRGRLERKVNEVDGTWTYERIKGIDGTYRYIWCIYDSEQDEFIPLTVEQTKIFWDIKKKHYQSISDLTFKYDCLKREGEISEKESMDNEEDLKRKRKAAYFAFKRELEKTFKAEVCLVTQFIDEIEIETGGNEFICWN